MQRETVLESFDRICAQQRRRILLNIYTTEHYQSLTTISQPDIEKAERRHRLERLGPALHHKGDTRVVTICGPGVHIAPREPLTNILMKGLV